MNDAIEPATRLDDLDIDAIKRMIPHRYPFLMLDRVVDIAAGDSAVGIKNVTVNEPQFEGHFPDQPIMPGVLIIEAMAQTAAVAGGRQHGTGRQGQAGLLHGDRAGPLPPAGACRATSCRIKVSQAAQEAQHLEVRGRGDGRRHDRRRRPPSVGQDHGCLTSMADDPSDRGRRSARRAGRGRGHRPLLRRRPGRPARRRRAARIPRRGHRADHARRAAAACSPSPVSGIGRRTASIAARLPSW